MPIKLSREYLPFLLSDSPKIVSDDIHVNFIPICELPKINGTFITQIFSFQVYETKESFVRLYKEQKTGNKNYALLSSQSHENLRVYYLPENENLLSTGYALFQHIALEEQLIHYNRMILHASCVETQYGGVLFSGKSGIGKSTQAELWKELERSTVINGDRTILYKKDDHWIGSGSPYAGSSEYYVNRQVPVTAVVMLEQASDCCIQKLKPSEAFRCLYAGMVINTWNPDFVSRIVELIEIFVTEIPVYHLACTPDADAVTILKQELNQQGGWCE